MNVIISCYKDKLVPQMHAYSMLYFHRKRYLLGQAEKLMGEHFQGDGLFYKEGWEHILEKHGGKLPISIKQLPISIKAVPEGMVAVLFTMVNTDPKCFWLTNFLETLLVQVWYPMTVCTNSRYQKLSIHKALEATGNEVWGIPGGSVFKLHDFGFRGASSVESAAIGGAGHLVNFIGTDTVAALLCTKRYYRSAKASGFSIPASEHSTITSWGVKGEEAAFKNMLEQYPTGIVACVSDSFDVFKACEEFWGGSLKEMIKGRISGDKWGPPYIRVIQGDGVDWESIPKILSRLAEVNRDTFKCAFKCAEITINGKASDVFKAGESGIPGGTGFLHYSSDGQFVTVSSGKGDPAKDILVEVFKDGQLLKDWTFDEIRKRADIPNGPFSQ
ncbi:unnamed protein product [Polarella glacialis]|uniref:Nicotinamide phosphoribosyltransferase n=1 Tax=Polarella glacialis TaxID=89957 RepID=A0A813FKQ1_POLGL|nr:unnamed protein product [Polarella glacialis]